jgi:hypothetical protein
MKPKPTPYSNAKLARRHPWRGFVEHPPKDVPNEYNHPALPAKMNRPI